MRIHGAINNNEVHPSSLCTTYAVHCTLYIYLYNLLQSVTIVTYSIYIYRSAHINTCICRERDIGRQGRREIYRKIGRERE